MDPWLVPEAWESMAPVPEAWKSIAPVPEARQPAAIRLDTLGSVNAKACASASNSSSADDDEPGGAKAPLSYLLGFELRWQGSGLFDGVFLQPDAAAYAASAPPCELSVRSALHRASSVAAQLQLQGRALPRSLANATTRRVRYFPTDRLRLLFGCETFPRGYNCTEGRVPPAVCPRRPSSARPQHLCRARGVAVPALPPPHPKPRPAHRRRCREEQSCAHRCEGLDLGGPRGGDGLGGDRQARAARVLLLETCARPMRCRPTLLPYLDHPAPRPLDYDRPLSPTAHSPPVLCSCKPGLRPAPSRLPAPSGAQDGLQTRRTAPPHACGCARLSEWSWPTRRAATATSSTLAATAAPRGRRSRGSSRAALWSSRSRAYAASI